MISKPSKEAYANIKNIKTKRQQVLEIIDQQGPIENWKIAKQLTWPINQVTGRTRELYLEGTIEFNYDASENTGKQVKFWKIKREYEQTTLVDIPATRSPKQFKRIRELA